MLRGRERGAATHLALCARGDGLLALVGSASRPVRVSIWRGTAIEHMSGYGSGTETALVSDQGTRDTRRGRRVTPVMRSRKQRPRRSLCAHRRRLKEALAADPTHQLLELKCGLRIGPRSG